jgi:hypothetical protein
VHEMVVLDPAGNPEVAFSINGFDAEDVDPAL